MNRRNRLIVLGVVLIAAAFVFIYPRLRAPRPDGQFAATSDPAAALAAAAAEDRPALLEFYGAG
ncbi:MAG: hypothetical protein ACOX8W_12050 [bacterium]|jgi:hypothetical protein